MNEHFPFLKAYSAFILDNHIDSLTLYVIQKAKALDLPVLKLLSHLTEEEIFQLSKTGFCEQILIPLSQSNPYIIIKERISSWKANSILIPKEQLSIFDVTSIYGVRKLGMIEFLKFYDYSKEEGIELIKEIEEYFGTCINLGLGAYEEIQRGELKEKNEILSGILDHIPVIVTRIDKEGYITQSLGAGLKLLGYENNNFKGTNVFADYPEAENIKKAIAGESIDFTGNAKSKTGYQRHYRSYFFPEPDGALGFSLDITETYLAEEALRKNKEKLKELNAALEEKVKARTEQLEKQKEYIYSVLMQAPAAIAILKGPSLIYELSTPLYYKLVGKKDLIGKPGREAIPELSDQGIWDIMDNVYQSGIPFMGNEFFIMLDREDNGVLDKRYFNFIAVPLRSNEGIVEGVMIHATEVTKQVLATIEAKESAERFLKVLEGIPPMTWTALPNGEVNYFSQRWCKFTGQTLEEALGNGWEKVLYADDIQPTWQKWKSALKSGVLYEMENRIKKASDGQYYWFLVRGIPLKNQDGDVIQWVGTCTEINEHKTLQEKLLNNSKELAAINEELIAANEEISATNDELADSNSKLSQINADLDNFIYTASHDLKAPISNIEGLMRVLFKNLPAEALDISLVKNVFLMIKASIDRFKNTIQNLTEITKLQKEGGGEAIVINFSELLEEVKLDLDISIKETDTKIIADADSCTFIEFSLKNLRSILYNLLSNAIKYHSPERKPIIHVSLKEEEDMCVLTVQDNGLGIDLSQKDKIFSMFKRLHTHVEGSGIGLYIVKKIIDNAGGKIEVESEVGKGSTFHVYLKSNKQ